eukprot:TRINITY_DN12057_c6_g4_i4.p1 TRINITY_DN12057_c6_g4~~TRINITY_DN12057_c6_g4_i4.p1  ORF type:complete len:964 (+),score=233.61 TRINITY_DN12057_c6_g4_i4:27-2894(+)
MAMTAPTVSEMELELPACFNKTDVQTAFGECQVPGHIQRSALRLLSVLGSVDEGLLTLSIDNISRTYTITAIVVATRSTPDEGLGVVCTTQTIVSNLLIATQVHFLDFFATLSHFVKLLSAVDGGHVVPTPLLPELGRYGQELCRVYSVTAVLNQRLNKWLEMLLTSPTSSAAIRLKRFIWLAFLTAKADRLKQALHRHTQALLYLLVCAIQFACMHCTERLVSVPHRSYLNEQGADVDAEHSNGLTYLIQLLQLEADEVKVIYKCFWRPFVQLHSLALRFQDGSPSAVALEHFDDLYRQALVEEHNCGIDERAFIEDCQELSIPGDLTLEPAGGVNVDDMPAMDDYDGYESPPEMGNIAQQLPAPPAAQGPHTPTSQSSVSDSHASVPSSPVRQSLNASKHFRAMLRDQGDHPSLQLAGLLVACDSTRRHDADTCQDVTKLIQHCSARFVAGYVSECGEASQALATHLALQGRCLTWRLLDALAESGQLAHTSLKRIAVVRAAIAISFEAILASGQWDASLAALRSHGGRTATGVNSMLTFTWVLTVVETTAFNVLKLLEPSIRTLFRQFPFLVSHLHLVEQQIIQRHLWSIGSDLMAGLLQAKQHLPPLPGNTSTQGLGTFARPPRKRALFIKPSGHDASDQKAIDDHEPSSLVDVDLQAPAIEALPESIGRLHEDPTKPRGPIISTTAVNLTETAMNLLRRKVYPFVAERIRQLFYSCTLSVRDLCMHLCWTVVYHALTHHIHLLEGLCLDQLILCAAYASGKRLLPPDQHRKFLYWFQLYDQLPNSDMPSVQTLPLTWTRASVDVPRTAANLRVHVVDGLSVATVDLPTFYNTIFVPNMRSFLLRFSPTNCSNLTPFPDVRATGKVRMLPSTPQSHKLGGARLFLSPIVTSANIRPKAQAFGAVAPPSTRVLALDHEDDDDDDDDDMVGLSVVPMLTSRAKSRKRVATETL